MGDNVRGLTIDSDFSNAGHALTTTGSGTVVLSAANSLSGPITVQSGTLEAAAPAALGGSGNFHNLSVAAGATLAVMVGGTGQWSYSSPNDIATLLADANSYPIFAAGASLGIDTGDASVTYSGTIADTSQGALTLTKLGDGTLTLSGTNSYSGGTAIDAGTLAFASTIALPNTADGILINSGGALAVSGAYTTVAGWLNSRPDRPQFHRRPGNHVRQQL